MTAILLRTRPPEGLLGGMVETPTSAWEPDYEPSRAMLDAPIEARWQRLPGIVRHVFTHFPLELTVLFAKVPRGTPEPAGYALDPAARPARGGAAGSDEEGAGARLRRCESRPEAAKRKAPKP